MQRFRAVTDPDEKQSRLPPGLSPLTLFLASLGSVVATLLVSRFGVAGTLTGAALVPIIVSVVRELGQKPVQRVARLPSGARAVVERAPKVRPRVVAITSVTAFLIAVAAFTLPDLIAGESVVADRPSTFFSSGRGGGPAEGTTTPTTTDGPAVTAPAPTTTTAPQETTAPTTTTAPPATAPIAPAAPVAPVAPPAPEAPSPVPEPAPQTAPEVPPPPG